MHQIIQEADSAMRYEQENLLFKESRCHCLETFINTLGYGESWITAQ